MFQAKMSRLLSHQLTNIVAVYVAQSSRKDNVRNDKIIAKKGESKHRRKNKYFENTNVSNFYKFCTKVQK